MNTVSNWFQRLLRSSFQFLLRVLAGQSKDKTCLEVERKFRLTDQEAERLPDELARRGFAAADAVDMTDTFLPVQQEGDMARLRVEKHKGTTRILLTLKSWVKTPDGGKERQETENQVGRLATVFLMLVGRKIKGADLLSFSKHRRHFTGTLDGRQAVVSIDRVQGLGEYSGLYLEVEILVPLGEDVNPARRQIATLVAGLLGEEREMVKLSYMEMLKLVSAKAPIS
ncbi:MAG TPA: CYTH domain-containing protein [Candidatus Obscuribacterales bacterium]